MKGRIIQLGLSAACMGAVLLSLALRTTWYEIAEEGPLQAPEAVGQSGQVDPLVLYYHERRPYYMHYRGEVHGLVADNVTLALNNAGIAFIWEEVPASRQLALLKNNSTKSCAVGWFKTPERELFAKFTAPVYQDKPHVVVTRAQNELLVSGISLEGVLSHWQLRLLVKSGYSYGPVIDAALKDKKPWLIPTTTDNYSMLQMIRNHRADYCFMSEEEAGDLLLFSNLNQADFKIIHISDMPKGSKRYVLCSNKVEDDIIGRVNTAIEETVYNPSPVR